MRAHLNRREAGPLREVLLGPTARDEPLGTYVCSEAFDGFHNHPCSGSPGGHPNAGGSGASRLHG
jgi:hypothetical protein